MTVLAGNDLINNRTDRQSLATEYWRAARNKTTTHHAVTTAARIPTIAINTTSYHIPQNRNKT
jgi:hypothetical protein